MLSWFLQPHEAYSRILSAFADYCEHDLAGAKTVESTVDLLGCCDGVQDCDDGRNVNSSPDRQIDLRNQHAGGDDKTVECESDDVCNDLANEEEGVDHVHSLPQLHFLHISQNTPMSVAS